MRKSPGPIPGVPTKNLSKMAKKRKAKKKKKISYNQGLAKKISINNLILIGIYSVMEKRKKCTFEALTNGCFSLFPESFGFSQYPKWPDVRKLDRPLRALRKMNLITGSSKTSFSLTTKGKKIVAELVKTFRQRKLL